MTGFLNIANLVTVLRVGLLFVLIFFIYDQGFPQLVLALFLVILIILMDGYDGYLARKYHVETRVGSVLDITGDRIVENVLWIVFSHLGLVSVWVPIIVISRGLLTDSIRSVALSHGMTAFGKDTMMKSRLSRLIVSSHTVRFLYGALKAVAFVLLLLEFIVIQYPHNQYTNFIYENFSAYNLFTDAIVAAVVFLCLIRGIPVILESKKLFRED